MAKHGTTANHAEVKTAADLEMISSQITTNLSLTTVLDLPCGAKKKNKNKKHCNAENHIVVNQMFCEQTNRDHNG